MASGLPLSSPGSHIAPTGHGAQKPSAATGGVGGGAEGGRAGGGGRRTGGGLGGCVMLPFGLGESGGGTNGGGEGGVGGGRGGGGRGRFEGGRAGGGLKGFWRKLPAGQRHLSMDAEPGWENEVAGQGKHAVPSALLYVSADVCADEDNHKNISRSWWCTARTRVRLSVLCRSGMARCRAGG